ncbi:E3 ubiquitin-protein ligase RNF180 isoform X1 [Hippoglossus hippoglossus]|uniref:E3 ubiquitin-protein ligase RNF180 isoform X1 n=1 Tax=Hippoglossus hippoglossus TaxID=8267 RepID=UPI00148E6AD4|nr:E3 ubiquitin-protein ligase RNF180 isoform X1 [Hippoglossus hippoglossus]XP_034459192.1 E3 ubiquitin-protein ligase RNF180 isoform X1 [Hippoglossus hippoglossus]
MLRCRRCRKGVIDSTCLSTEEATEESSGAICSIWHVNVDALPDWILTSVHQAQWTVGKLNCHNCGARLGGFNFINHTKCPCGQDATVHLNKSRVDRDHKHHVLIVQPRRTRPEKGRAAPPTDSAENNEETFNGTEPDSLQVYCAAVTSHIRPEEASSSPSENQSFPFSPLYCISHRRRGSLEDGATFRSSCFCPASLMDRSAAGLTWAGPDDESTWSPVSCPTRQDAAGEASGDADAFGSLGGRRLLLDQPLLPTSDTVESSVATTTSHEDASDSTLFLRGRTVSDSVAERDEETEPRASSASPASISRRRKERNRLKGLRRKQRRRERWLHRWQEQAESLSRSLVDSEEEDREGLTCAVCLDVFFSPYSCQPCAHVFCEPCLRTLAKNRHTNTPCPLCRTLISHTDLHEELNQTVKTFFPKVYYGRQLNFKKAPCAKWPLPSCRTCFRTFWGYQRHVATVRGRWHFAHGAFSLDALNFTDMRGWLFDVGLFVDYVRSVNWILAFLLLCFLVYFFFF